MKLIGLPMAVSLPSGTVQSDDIFKSFVNLNIV